MSGRRELSEREEEGFKYGRLLGLLKRVDPEAFELLHEMAASEGVTPIELIARSIRAYREQVALTSVDPKCLASALGVVDLMMRRVTGMINMVVGVFMSDFFRTQMGVFQELMRASEEEESKAKERPGLPPKVREVLANTVAALMSTVINTLMASMRSVVPGAPAPPVSPQVRIPTSFGSGAQTRRPKVRES